MILVSQSSMASFLLYRFDTFAPQKPGNAF